jgi:hypothetical protein
MKIERIALVAVITVILLVGGYAVFLITISWPIEELSISSAGLYGDSFGVLNSLFSGFAFAGIIITILLQRDELRLQRLELERSSVAQESSARMAALSLLLADYKNSIASNSDTLNKMHGNLASGELERINAESTSLCMKRDFVLAELEKITKIDQGT